MDTTSKTSASEDSNESVTSATENTSNEETKVDNADVTEVSDTSTILSLITSNEETDEQIDEEQATGTEEVTIDDEGVDDSLSVTEVTVKQSSNSTENSSNG